MVVPAPTCSNEPAPSRAAEIVNVSERLIVRIELLVSLPVPSVPAVPPTPTFSRPDRMSVVPLYVLLPVSIVVPVPICSSEPVPPIS